jgi:hypothetical protein
MTQYQKYLKDWTSERGITSFLGSDKPAFQQDWKEEKKGLRFGEMESMGGEDINRAGEPFKKPKPKAKTKAKNKWYFKVHNYREAQKWFRSNYNGATDEIRGVIAPNRNLYDEQDWNKTTDGGNIHSPSSPLLKLAKYLEREGVGQIIEYLK